MESKAVGFSCDGLLNEGILVSNIREDLVPESLVSKYFGAKATKSGWKYNLLTTHAEQLAILSLYRRIYSTSDIPNKEISLQFARGLIWMSLGNMVNWSQFKEERSRVREGLKKKAKERKVKREGEALGLDFGASSNLAKKRCNARREADAPDSFPLSLSLTMKSESELLAQCATMSAGKVGAKALRKGLGKVFSINSPKWLEEDLKRIEEVVQETGVLLEESRVSLLEKIAEVSEIESKLHRSRLSLADRIVILQESKHQMETLCITEESLCLAMKTKQTTEECDKERVDLEDLLSKKKMEERTLHCCEGVVEDLASNIRNLEDHLSWSVAGKSVVCIRVSSLEALMQAILEQLLSMHEGGGTIFFPQPVVGHPVSPVALTHSLNACPICSLRYASFDYVSITCGHTYHPFCLWVHSKSSSKCAMPSCEEQFGNLSVASLGLRPNVAQPVPIDMKMSAITPANAVQSISILAPSRTTLHLFLSSVCIAMSSSSTLKSLAYRTLGLFVFAIVGASYLCSIFEG